MLKTNDNSEKSKSKSIKKTPLPNINQLQNIRIIQKHLVYVIGLSSNLAQKELLAKYEYFGQYGQITKIVVNKNKAYNPYGPNGPSFSAYISYSTHQESSLAILSIDNTLSDEHVLRASYGTTKYCTYYLKGLECPNKDCLYLHHLADSKDIINRDDMNSNKSIFLEQQLLAIRIADIYNPEVKQKILNSKKSKCVLPHAESIYMKEIVIDNDPSNESYSKYNYYDKNNNNFYKKKYKGYDNIEELKELDSNFNEDNSFDYEKSRNNLTQETKPRNQSNEDHVPSMKNHLSSLFKDKKKIISPTKKNEKENGKTPNIKPTLPNEKDRKTSFNSAQDSNNPNRIDFQNKRKGSSESHPILGVKKGKLFQNKQKSRFGFVKSESEDSVEIPDFIIEIINKRIKRNFVMKTMFFECDLEIVEENIFERKKNHSWIEFLMNMKKNLSKPSESFKNDQDDNLLVKGKGFNSNLF